MRRAFSAGVALVFAAVLPACGGVDSGGTAEPLTVLRVGVPPDEDPESLRQKYAALMDAVTRDLDIRYELTMPEDYQSLIDLFLAHELDLAEFGGYSFLLVCEEIAAVPLVQRDIDTRFTSYFIAKGDNGSEAVQDFQGKTISFGLRLSTSGHLMPRSYLNDQGIDPETFFGEVRYSSAHDRTVLQVRDGEVDLGAVNAQLYDAMLEAGTITTGDVRIVVETPPYANYIWAAHPSIQDEDVIRIRDAFLGLSARDEEQRQVLASMGAGTYLPARMADYRKMRELVRSLQRP